jgi:hypothetical protein
MKHAQTSSGWTFGTEPFPAFRVSLSYGRNQNSRGFIAVNGVTPNDRGELPENAFQVRKTAEGQVVISAGEDSTQRCLLFVGQIGGFRGGVSILEEETTGKVLASCSASNACESGIECIALLDVGQAIAFHRTGRNTNEIMVYSWDGVTIEEKAWAIQDWNRRNDPPRSKATCNLRPGNYRILTLKGDEVDSEAGLPVADQAVSMPGFGEQMHLAHFLTSKPEAKGVIRKARVGTDMYGELVLAPCVKDVPLEGDTFLVLVHEYYPGSGHKRWPGFHIDWENAGPVEVLCSVRRGKGSGDDTYTLVLAPAGWAQNIAAQFRNERDFGDQEISYKPR